MRAGNGVVYGDLYVLADYDAVIGRDVTLDKLPAQRLRVANGGYEDAIGKAYYSFTDKHPEYMVSIANSLNSDNLLQSMMNRDSSVDILHPVQHGQRVCRPDEPRLYGRTGRRRDTF